MGVGASVVGTALAYAAMSLLAPSLEQSMLQGETVMFGARTIGVIVAIAVASSMLAGVWPALIAVRSHRWGGLQSNAGQSSDSGAGRTVRRGFVLAQVAMATMLLIGAGVIPMRPPCGCA